MRTAPAPSSQGRAALTWFFAALTVALFLCSIFVLTSAPTAALWIASIVAAEWGHFVALLAIAIAAASWRRGRLGLVTALLALITAAICLTPLCRAMAIAQSLPERCTSAFGGKAVAQPRPLSIARLFRFARSAEVEVTEHVYARPDRKKLKLDLYRARNAPGPQPLVVVVHGGAWSSGSRKNQPALNSVLAEQGYTVAAIDYRHAPRWQFPAPIEDVFTAIEFLRRNADRLQLDLGRIVLVGRSAGAQIALCAAYAGREPNIRGVIAFYGPTDLVLGYAKPSRRAVLDSKTALEQYLGGPPAQNPHGYAAASPLNAVNATTPPTLLVHGALDAIVWPVHSELLAARLQAAGRPHLYLALPWATHGCDAVLNGPSGQLSTYAATRFLDAVFRDAAAE